MQVVEKMKQQCTFDAA